MINVLNDSDAAGLECRMLKWVKEVIDQNFSNEDKLIEGFERIIEEHGGWLKECTDPCRRKESALPDQPDEVLEMKNRLLTHITHEFLTPLNLIITPLEQMLPRCEDPEQKKLLSMMYRNSQRLLLVIIQILELLKLESRKLKLKAGKQDLIPFLKGITASFELLAEQQEVTLILDSDKENIPLYFDAEKMAEVMCNLIMNALKYTPPGGQVRVSVCELPSGPVEISVHNSGEEIPVDEMRLIFDRYYQLNKRFEHYIKGLGIGLFLAREYIKLHHGTVDVNSGAGYGTEFVIRLPKGKNHLNHDEIVEPSVYSGAEEVGCKTSKRYAYMVQLEREEKGKNRPVNGEVNGIERDKQEGDIVLVIEDNTDMRGFIKSLLTDEGFLVKEAENGKQGIVMAKKIIPDIIVSDVMMPDTSGYQVCVQLKQDVVTSHIPIILLSVKYTEEEIIRGLEAGADDYVTKPFKMDILLTRIKNLIKMRRKLQQRVQWETVTHPDELRLSTVDTHLLKKIRDAVEENLSDPEFGQAELADFIDISRTSLYRKIMALTGQSPGKFIQAYRLKRSVDLLKTNPGSITDVAFSVGFSSSAYFTKCFKEKFKRLPSNFYSN